MPHHLVFIHRGDTKYFQQGFRKALTIHYANNDCHFIDIRGTIQEPIADEALQILQKKGFDITYQVNLINK